MQHVLLLRLTLSASLLPMQVLFGSLPIASCRDPYSVLSYLAARMWPRLHVVLGLHKVRAYVAQGLHDMRVRMMSGVREVHSHVVLGVCVCVSVCLCVKGEGGGNAGLDLI